MVGRPRPHAGTRARVTADLTGAAHSFGAPSLPLRFVCWVLAAAGISLPAESGETAAGVRGEEPRSRPAGWTGSGLLWWRLHQDRL